jgi:uncharacterized protein YacL
MRSLVASKAFQTLAIAATLIAFGTILFGFAGAASCLLLAFLVAAWRHDNDLGTCFPLALLFVIVVLIMVALLAMLGWLWARHQ